MDAMPVLGEFCLILFDPPWHCITLHYIALIYFTINYWYYYTLLYIITHYCRFLRFIVVLIVLYLFRIYTFFVCLLNDLPLYFVLHLEMGVAPLDPQSVTDRNMAHNNGTMITTAAQQWPLVMSVAYLLGKPWLPDMDRNIRCSFLMLECDEHLKMRCKNANQWWGWWEDIQFI
jgi:hypothetical protein